MDTITKVAADLRAAKQRKAKNGGSEIRRYPIDPK